MKKGDRIAQLVCERICYPDLVELEVRNVTSVSTVARCCVSTVHLNHRPLVFQTLEETERGAGGFGSTGRN